jgi:sugar lactone lactonase YvrE
MGTFLVVLGSFLLASPGSVRAHPPSLAGPVEVFAEGVNGPEGLAFAKDGSLIVGTTDGQLLRFTADGSWAVIAELGESLSGITVLRDGRVLAASFNPGRVWSFDPASGLVTVQASGISGPNFIVQTRRGRILVSASLAGTIVEITDGTPVVRGTGLNFPNGLAIGDDGFLYVAETLQGRISRLALADDGSLGAPELYASGTPIADGIAFDPHGNLLVTGNDTLQVVARGSTMGTVLSSDPLLNWPSNLAFGHGRRFRRRDIYLVNYGVPLGSGTNIVRFRYNHSGAKLVR